MIDYFNLRNILYDKYGAMSRLAFSVISSMRNYHKEVSVHELTRTTGVAFKFVQEIIYLLEIPEKEKGIYSLNDDLLKAADMIAREYSELSIPASDDVIESVSQCISSFQKHKMELDHVSAIPRTCIARAELLAIRHDPLFCNFLFLGDHDFTSIAFAILMKKNGIKANIFVVDIDEDVLSHIAYIADKHQLNITIAVSDFRYSIPKCYKNKMDVIFTDPPYTPEGMSLFLNRGIECASLCPFSSIYISYKSAETSPAIGLAVQKAIASAKLYINELIHNFNQYYGAEALGYRSDLYVCSFTTASRNVNFQKSLAIYTHGRNSIESKKSKSLNLNLLLEIISFISKEEATEITLVSNNSYRLAQDICKVYSIDEYIEQRLNNSFCLSSNSILVFAFYGAELSDISLALKLTREKEYYVIYNLENSLLSKLEVFNWLSLVYNITKLSSFNGMTLYKFKFIDFCCSEAINILSNVFISKNSMLKNSISKSISTIFQTTRNEGRSVLSNYSKLRNFFDLMIYELPEYYLKDLRLWINSICSK